MATDSTGGAAASAAITALGNYAITAATNKKDFQRQKEAMKLQDTYNRNLWDYQNEYNTPQKQMERLKAAGLNPYLVYGGGSANTGNAGPIGSLDVPAQQTASGQLPDFMATHLNARQMDQQYEASQANMDLIKRRAALTDVQTGLENLKLMRENMRSKNYESLNFAEKKTQQMIAARMGEMYLNEQEKGSLMTQLHDQRAKRFPLEQRSLNLENTFKKYRNNLAEVGIYSSDSPMYRAIIALAHRTGTDVGELLNKGADWLKAHL